MAETDSRILEYLEEGLFLYGVGKVQESINRWRKVLELDPKNERAMDYIESAGGDVSAFRAKAGGPTAPPPMNVPSNTVPNMTPFSGEGAAIKAAPPPRPPAPAPAPVAPPRPPPAPVAMAAPAPRPAAPAPFDPFAPTSAGVPSEQFPSRPTASSGPPPMPPVPRAPAPLPPTPPIAKESREEMLSKAAALYRAKYHEAALELLERIARDHPPVDDTLKGYLDASRAAVLDTLRAQWSRTDLVPKPRLGPNQIMQLKLSSEAGFILSRIDGMSSIEEILSMCGLDQFTALRALNALLQQGAIELGQ